MGFERPPQFNQGQVNQGQETSEIETPEKKITAEKKITPEQQERQKRIVDLLQERLGAEQRILTDEELANLTRQIANEVGVEGDIFANSENRPLVFYRAFSPTKEVEELVAKDENIIRPFGYAMPGIVSGKSKDLPLAYGGENPVLIRIIDTGGYWEDTAPYWGFAPHPGTWDEAINIDPIVLKKINERSLTELEARRQIGREHGNEETPFRQITFVVDKVKTESLQNDPNNLEPFLNDVGFWRELKERALNFIPPVETNEYSKKLSKKYLEYFDKTIRVDEEKVVSEAAKQALRRAQAEIYALIDKATDDNNEDSWWTAERRQQILKSFSDEARQKYSQWKGEAIE